ncbi:unnamed protein product [Umbelopsis ramanniana]
MKITIERTEMAINTKRNEQYYSATRYPVCRPKHLDRLKQKIMNSFDNFRTVQFSLPCLISERLRCTRLDTKFPLNIIEDIPKVDISSFFFFISLVSKWVAVQQDAIDTARTSPTPRADSAVVSPMPSSESTILVVRRRLLMTSLFASISSPTNMNNFPLKLSKLVVSAVTSIWLRPVVRTPSTCVSASILSTSPVSTRCCLALVPIDCKPVCVVLSVSPTVLLPVSTLVRSSSPSAPRTTTSMLSLRLSDVASTSSLVNKRSLSPRTGVSPS